MNTDEITQRIYIRSDRDLRAKINASVKWVWDESGHSCERPNSRLEEIQSELGGGGSEFALNKVPWIGAAIRMFEVVAFHYLRDKYRSQAVSDFMAKVESVQEIIDSQ